MSWQAGDCVEWESMGSRYVFYGVIEGFVGKSHDMAMCTDQTGRGSRPVSVGRLRPRSKTYWYTGLVA